MISPAPAPLPARLFLRSLLLLILAVALAVPHTKSDACPGVDMKYAGTVRRVNTGRLSQLLDSGDIVLVGCLGYSASVPPSTDSPDGAGITHRWFRAPIRAKFSIARRRRSPRNVPPRSSALALPLFFVSLSSHPWWADVPQLGAQKLIFMYEGDEVFNLEHVCSGGADGQVVQSMDPDLAGRCIAAIEEQRAPLPCPRRQLSIYFVSSFVLI